MDAVRGPALEPVWARSSYSPETLVAKKRGDRTVVTMRSTESGHVYVTEKNRRNDAARLELRKYDPAVRRHVLYRETR